MLTILLFENGRVAIHVAAPGMDWLLMQVVTLLGGTTKYITCISVRLKALCIPGILVKGLDDAHFGQKDQTNCVFS
jgi:hypothetical protein